MGKPLLCKHGNQYGVTVEPAEFYAEGMERPADQVIHRVTMPVCDECMMEALVGSTTLAYVPEPEKEG